MFLGIDLGTSSVKAVLVDEQGHVVASAGQEYPILTPQSGWAEQAPQDWWHATRLSIQQLLQDQDGQRVQAIGLAGHMHGVAFLGEDLRPSSQAIIWADQRSAQQVQQMIDRAGAERLVIQTGTLPAAGFMGPTLLWLQAHDPGRLAEAHKLLLPKDYLRLCLTGTLGSDISDASATSLFDINTRNWAFDLVENLDLPAHLLPELAESSAIIGTLLPTVAQELGLPPGIPCVAGCADQAAQALRNGLLEPGQLSITLGTGGQIFTALAQPEAHQALHTFCHAVPDRWYLLGAMLSGGLSLRWLRDLLRMQAQADAYATLVGEAALVPAGADGLLFLPYLAGERAPLMDPLASGSFVGLTLSHQRGHLARAVMEGVAFALRQILELMPPHDEPVLAVGNALRGPIWRQMLADVTGLPLAPRQSYEDTGAGAAWLAAMATGTVDPKVYVPVNDALTLPDSALKERYDARYALFTQAYGQMQPLMHQLKASP